MKKDSFNQIIWLFLFTLLFLVVFSFLPKMCIRDRLYNNIGRIYDSQSDYAKSLEYYNKSLSIYESVLGPDHPDVATLYNNIGLVYSSQGDYAKSLEHYNKLSLIHI